MQEISFMMSVSLDGFMARPDGDLSWQHVDEELHTHFNRWLATMSAFLDGRVTYELMASYWPAADADPAAPAPVAEFAQIWRDMPKIVYSRTLDQAGWNTTVAREVVAAEVRRLQAQPGGGIVVGGANLAATFIRLDLIDEYRLYVHPVVLGRGLPAFTAPDVTVPLRLAETQVFGSGVVMLRYRRPDPAAAEA